MSYKTIDVDYDDDGGEASLETTRCYRAAREYRRRGLNPVPCHPTKKCPAIAWKELQSRLVTDEEMLSHYALYAGGVGVITGTVSGVIVIESDGPEGEAVLAAFTNTHSPLPDTLTIRSGSGRGLHRYFQHPGGHVPTRANPSIKLDVRGNGGFSVSAPSLHKSGGRYEVVSDTKPAPLPDGLLAFIEAESGKAKSASSKSSDQGNTDDPRQTADSRLGENTSRFEPLHVNPVNAAIIMTMLDALPDSFASARDDWLKVGFSLHDFDSGEVGLALWRKFSHRCQEKAGQTDFAAIWRGFDSDRSGRKITIGSLRHSAEAHGWRAQRPWDRSTNSTSTERVS